MSNQKAIQIAGTMTAQLNTLIWKLNNGSESTISRQVQALEEDFKVLKKEIKSNDSKRK